MSDTLTYFTSFLICFLDTTACLQAYTGPTIRITTAKVAPFRYCTNIHRNCISTNLQNRAIATRSLKSILAVLEGYSGFKSGLTTVNNMKEKKVQKDLKTYLSTKLSGYTAQAHTSCKHQQTRELRYSLLVASPDVYNIAADPSLKKEEKFSKENIILSDIYTHPHLSLSTSKHHWLLSQSDPTNLRLE